MDIDYKEIAQTIKRFWAGKGITIQQAAEMLGISAQAVCNQLSGKPISPKTAKMYHSIWGFNEDYMITGRGTLLGAGDTPTPMDGEIRIPRETLALYENMSESLRILSQLVERYAPREAASIIKGGIYPLDHLNK